MQSPTLTASPHAHAPVSVSRTMGLVILALVPATLFGFYLFGLPGLWLFLITIVATVGFEALTLWLAGRPPRAELLDGSALLTGWLLAMTLPPWAPWWIGVLGGFLAVVFGKQIFGGIGQNPFNPAMVARVAMLIAFPLEMTRFVRPEPLFSAGSPGPLDSLAVTFGAQANNTAFWDAVSGASVLGHVRTELGEGRGLSEALAGVYDPMAALIGNVSGSLGETSALLLGLGGLFLIYKRIIGWAIPVSILVTIAVFATAMHLINPNHYPDAGYHLLTGSAILCAFFIATDPVTSPVSRTGQLVYGMGIGALIYAIRSFGGYPEGVAFSVLLLNACTPMIDHYIKPRVYGRDRRGRPIEYTAKARTEKV